MRGTQAMIAELCQYSRKDLRRGLTANFWMTLLSLAMLTYFIWWFDYIDGIYNSVVVNLLPAVLIPMVFYEGMQKREARRFDWVYAGFVFLLLLTLLLAISDTYDIQELGINAVMLMMSAPWLFVFGMLVRRKRILAIGMVPAGFLLMGYWVLPELMDGSGVQRALFPLPVVAILVAAWTFLVWVLFRGLDRWPRHPTLGPLMESLSMLFLFMPLMVLAIWVPRTFPGGEDWSVVLAAMVGVVFGSVVSEPLTRFLRSYGDLPSLRKCDGGDKVEQDQDGEG